MMDLRLPRVAPVALLASLVFLVAGSPEDNAGKRPAKAAPGIGQQPPAGPDKARKRMAMAQRRLERGQYRYAARTFRAILDHHPDNVRAMSGLGRALSGIGRCTDAMVWLEAVRGTPNWGADEAFAVGRCHERSGDYDLARADYEEALAYDRDYVTGWYALAQLDLRTDRADEAFDIENLLLTWDEGVRMSALLAVWRLREERGDEAAWEALAELNRMLDTRGGKGARVQSDLAEGLLWLDAGDPVTAEAVLRRAITAQPQQVRPRVYRAEAWRRMGNPQQALYEISDEWIVGPDAPSAQPVRAKILADLGQMPAALRELDGYPDPRDPELVAARWYVADKAGDAPTRERMAALWDDLVDDPARSLDHERPW